MIVDLISESRQEGKYKPALKPKEKLTKKFFELKAQYEYIYQKEKEGAKY